MQFNNARDPNSESIWVKSKFEQIPVNSCYSNLVNYGTNVNVNSPYSDPNLNGALVHKIKVPYPVEELPEIILKLGKPHKFNTNYKKEIEPVNCGNYRNISKYHEKC